jgi:hypothetical protein
MENPCMKNIWPGSIVMAYWHIEEVWKLATVVNRYGLLSHTYTYGESGNYPDLVTLKFHDGKPKKNSESHFTYGVVLRDCFLFDCPECRKRHIEKAWYALMDVAYERIPSYSHKQMIKLLKPKSLSLGVEK